MDSSFFCLASAASTQNTSDIAKLAANAFKESQACIACHEIGSAPLAVQQWAASHHAQVGVGRYECHQADKSRPDAFDHNGYSISVMVTPKSCGMCHAQQAEEFQASHHAQAGQPVQNVCRRLIGKHTSIFCISRKR